MTGLSQNGSREPNERDALIGDTIRANSGLVPRHKRRPWAYWPVRVVHLTWATLVRDYVNLLLVFVPFGIIAGALGWDSTAVFTLNFLAIVPLASLLSFATEELAAAMGQALGGLMNATFGNAVELIVSIIALKDGQIRVVQASMLGSILSNILLVLGCCFFVGGIRYSEQSFNTTVASTMSSLMTVASASLIIPATLYASLSSAGDGANRDKNILILSHGTAIILLILYVMYLYFQLKSHASFFEETTPDPENTGDEVAEEEEEHILSPWAACIALVVVTILVAVCADYLVGSIDPIVERTGMSRTFIGLILIPIVGNAAEHVTAVVVAWKGKMDLAIGVAIGSSLQIALFVTPFLVILGWILDVDMTLHFHIFETVAFFISGLVVTFLIQDGKSNYLEGGLCLGMYVILALAFYVYPDQATDDALFHT
ncbi:vacuolar calcium ion transporter [Aspergillus bombycis]|uniref:Vacuolar calcium ion transporter n=1 Tax=Aspergillus bombycis TaxID=109264 RepID=A0A1F8ABT4_9EURO|nr:vacuolar calcium ion transporter [Aspergillus bombycis]OGM49174.1 vacuolar calcium ion transporter [Aspergillus bombycis]